MSGGARVESTASVLFVCTGNTCRSALAEAFWRLLRPDIPVSSAGTQAWPGVPAAAEAVLVAASRGGNLSAHRARSLDEVSGAPDHVYVMTARQRDEVLARRPDWAGRVSLLTEAVGETGDIEDPAGGKATAYEQLGRHLWSLVSRLGDNLGPAPPEGGATRPEPGGQ